MTFLYSYQDKNGVHDGCEVFASSEAEAYSKLRKSGVRPMRVWAKPGFVNAILSIGKRGFAIVLLAVALLGLSAYLFTMRFDDGRGTSEPDDALTAAPRQQCPEVEVAFKYEAERVLALFARPGDARAIGVESKGSRGGVGSQIVFLLPDLEKSLRSPILPEDGDSEDAILLKRIVIGLKEEARMLLESRESAQDVLRFFVERQRMEVAYRESILRGVRMNPETLREANESLSRTGIEEISESECGKSN